MHGEVRPCLSNEALRHGRPPSSFHLITGDSMRKRGEESCFELHRINLLSPPTKTLPKTRNNLNY